jgi:CBS domain containing-hemolysin-like protein
VEDIMVPLIDVVVAPVTARVKDVIRLIHDSGHTRIPIFRERVDKIMGTVQATDLILADAEGSIQEFIRSPYIVPEGKSLEELLDELRENDVSIAIVVDEYGGVSGIATMENILEEIVGEIRDEYDVEETAEYRFKKDALEVAGRMRVDELNEILGLGLSEDQGETVAGLIVSHLGRIPSPGEKVAYAGHQFTVIQATDRRLLRLAITGPSVRQKMSTPR